MSFKIIEIDSWERRDSFELFSKFYDPVFSIGIKIKVPEDCMSKFKGLNIKPFNAILFSVLKACNKIENFRYRLGGANSVKLFDSIDPCWVEMNERAQLSLKSCQFNSDFNSFVNNMSTSKSIEINSDFAHAPYISTSTQPWFDLTSLSNIKFSKEDSIPKLVWGKIEDDSFHLNIDVNHKFVDGYYISLLKKEIEQSIESLVE